MRNRIKRAGSIEDEGTPVSCKLIQGRRDAFAHFGFGERRRNFAIQPRNDRRVIFMDEGRIVEDAKKEDFFGQPRSDRAQQFLSKILHH